MLFRHKELRDGDIRLLHLHRGYDKDLISITLSQHKLDIAPKFCALSYCWGDPVQSEELYCEQDQHPSGTLPLTPSLQNILRSIRAQDFPDELPLWIDQICINQKDNAEKIRQVKLMSQIYGKAERTLFHLGGREDNNKDLKDILETFTKDAKRYERYQYRENKLRALLRRPSAAQRKALASLLVKPWFTRLWVVQEYTMSRNRFVICSGKCVRWEDLHDGVSYVCFRRKVLDEPDKDIQQDLRMLWHVMQDLNPSAPELTGKASTTDLCHMLDKFGTKAASVPHDKVVALLGLADDVGDQNELINYQEPYLLTFARAVRLTITSRQKTTPWESLEILRLVDPGLAHRRQYKLSWVPDFGVEMDSTKILEAFEDHLNAWVFQAPETYHATRLSVRAVHIGTIEQQVPLITRKRFPALYQMSHRAANQGYTHNPALRKSWRTKQGLSVTTHEVCNIGDEIYVLDGLEETPCVLQRQSGTLFAFKGLAWAHTTDSEIGGRAGALHQQYVKTPMSKKAFWHEYWGPWVCKHDRTFPWTTEYPTLT